MVGAADCINRRLLQELNGTKLLITKCQGFNGGFNPVFAEIDIKRGRLPTEGGAWLALACWQNSALCYASTICSRC